MRRLIPILCAAALLAVPCAGQVSTVTLTGSVSDETGGLLPGASVVVRNDQTGLTRNATTDTEGRYTFVALPAVGAYSVTAELSGFASVVQTGFAFRANSKPVVNFQLNAGRSETVTVISEAPLLETRKAELSVTVDEQKIETTPLNGRRSTAWSRSRSRPATTCSATRWA